MLSPQATTMTITTTASYKHLKTTNSGHQPENDDENSIMLLPGLPNHLAHLCLSSLHPCLLYQVCRSWRRLIYSPAFPPFLSLYALLSPTKSANSIEFFSLDPISLQWSPLPPPPPIRLVRRHPSFISRTFSIQSLTVSGHLVLIAATAQGLLPALSRPLVFDPISQRWFFGPPLSAPRRWCATGSARGAVYVASGIGSHYHADVARRVEKWDLEREVQDWKWERMCDLKDGRFSREAVEIVGGFEGKLWMVNVKGSALKQGAVYDAVNEKWDDMPERAVEAWNGPAAVVDGESVMYMADEKKGSLRKFDFVRECWEVVVVEEEVLKGAEQMAAGGGRVCVVSGDGGRIVVVDVVAQPARVWVVNPPPGMEVVAVHILPRMS